MKVKVVINIEGLTKPLESHPWSQEDVAFFDGILKSILEPNAADGSLFFESTVGDARIPKRLLERAVILYVPVE